MASFLGERGCVSFLVPERDDKANKRFQIRSVKAPEPPVTSPRPAEVDEDLIAGILRQNLPRQGVLEADHFFTGAKIGEKNGAPSLRANGISDADSRFSFRPELGKPEEATGQLLVTGAFGCDTGWSDACRAKFGFCGKSSILLSTLSERLGFDVRVTKSLACIRRF